MSRPSGLEAASAARPLGWRGAAAIALTKWAAAGAVLATGFHAVSDDDFARVVIAEQWARAPRWDASGTSWLPFPFWIMGTAMAAFGRSVATARGTALALAVVAALLVYISSKWLGEDRGPATFGALVAAVFPWSARLGVATVPELPTAALTLLGMAALGGAALGRDRETRLLWGGAALGAAALSRYEAWPVALIFAAVCAVEAARTKRGRIAFASALAFAGPASWVAWNRIAHGDALHFLARVAAYKQALGGAQQGAAARLSAYPAAMVAEEPEIAALLAAALVMLALFARGPGVRDALTRYKWPAVLVAAQIAALSAAMIKDGAPTHHPERAVLCGLLLIAVCAGANAYRAVLDAHARRGWSAAAPAIGMLAIAVGLAAFFGRSPRRDAFADREGEVAVGKAAAALSRPGDRVLVEVPDYGYLAVIAGLGRPEDAVPDRSVDPRDAKVASSFVDAEAIRARVAESNVRWVVARRTDTARAALAPEEAVRGVWGVFRVQGAPR
ncbi:Hypothetical protein A7982_07491 [Minicystis rosea]|nr:Hypothetical protein A7982_07491 [Minicystis rosea]